MMTRPLGHLGSQFLVDITRHERGFGGLAPLPFLAGVIWNVIPYETPVIPAKAGIQSVDSAFPKVCGVDSRPSASSGQAFRGNDSGLKRLFLANPTTTGMRGACWAVCSSEAAKMHMTDVGWLDLK